MDLDYLAIVIAAVAAFIISGLWYGVFGGPLARLHPAYAEGGSPSGSDVVVELVRNLVLATVLGGLVTRLPVETWPGALLLGLVLWVGFPLVLLTGSVYHEKVPVPLAGIHAGDWLFKLLAMTLIIALWP